MKRRLKAGATTYFDRCLRSADRRNPVRVIIGVGADPIAEQNLS